MRQLFGLALLACCCLPQTPCKAAEPITVFFNLRPPYLLRQDDGTPAGLTGTPARQAFARAGIKVQWSEMPTNRQLLTIRENAGDYCAIGWFQTPERLQFAKFTRPIYRDQGWMVLVHAGLAVDGSETLPELLARPGLRVMVKDKYSYGPAIDALLAQAKPAIAVSTGTTLQMLQSLGARSVDLIFVSDEEGHYLLANSISQAGLRLLRLAQMPKGETRHIMCSRHMPDELIDRLNKAIRFNR
ncbi:substrate-binding periplasmic protein [Pseudoduganella violaceinigra]|uniref:substrate-binding periplasmic protein n=1 Tax=Pseudoduganella violaceinigra TaxID=246602 RepID=UPI000409B7FC|nr:transporter substrate-binding domain-containing protein [Pseudoduganella violaceinigra]